MLSPLFQYQFLQNAVAAALLASVLCGIMGVMITEKKIVMMSGGIAHTAYAGIGLGFFLNFEPIWGALGVAVAAAFGVSFIQRRTDGNADVIMALFWSMGMAMGILFIAFTPGYPPDMASYLFGNILAVLRMDLLFMGVLTAIVVVTITAFFHFWKAFLFDEEFASLQGINVMLMEHVLLVLVAMTVVVLIRVVGIILVLALLTAPPITARFFTDDFKKLMVTAVGLAAGCCMVGLWISYVLNIASGATIVLLSGLVFLASASFHHFRRLHHRPR